MNPERSSFNRFPGGSGDLAVADGIMSFKLMDKYVLIDLDANAFLWTLVILRLFIMITQREIIIGRG